MSNREEEQPEEQPAQGDAQRQVSHRQVSRRELVRARQLLRNESGERDEDSRRVQSSKDQPQSAGDVAVLVGGAECGRLQAARDCASVRALYEALSALLARPAADLRVTRIAEVQCANGETEVRCLFVGA